MKTALAALFVVFALRALVALQASDARHAAAEPRDPGVLVSLGSATAAQGRDIAIARPAVARDIAIVIEADRAIVFDQEGHNGPIVASSTDRAAIAGAITSLTSGMQTNVVIDAPSSWREATTYGAMMASLDAANAIGAEHIRFGYVAWSADEAFERGELVRALIATRALARGGDVSRDSAADLAERIDTLVDDRVRPVWHAWLAAHFDRSAGPYGRDPLHALLPARRTDRAAFDAFVARTRRRHHDEGTWGHDEERDLDLLGALEPAALPHAIDTIARGKLGDLGSNAISRWLLRGETRSRAWAAARERARALVGALDGSWWVGSAAWLCEPTSHAEVVATFDSLIAPNTGEYYDLARALDKIDACVALRARVGDVAAALLVVP